MTAAVDFAMLIDAGATLIHTAEAVGAAIEHQRIVRLIAALVPHNTDERMSIQRVLRAIEASTVESTPERLTTGVVPGSLEARPGADSTAATFKESALNGETSG